MPHSWDWVPQGCSLEGLGSLLAEGWLTLQLAERRAPPQLAGRKASQLAEKRVSLLAEKMVSLLAEWRTCCLQWEY